MLKDAIIDSTGKYRYMLKRQWATDRNNFVNFVMLNPSRADDKEDDPTVNACISFCKKWGYDGFYVTNLFALRTPDPKVLKASSLPIIGDENDFHIKKWAICSKKTIIAWGDHGAFRRRNKEVLNILLKIKTLHCVGTTKSGNPKHPLYVNRSTNPFVFNP